MNNKMFSINKTDLDIIWINVDTIVKRQYKTINNDKMWEMNRELKYSIDDTFFSYQFQWTASVV